MWSATVMWSQGAGITIEPYMFYSHVSLVEKDRTITPKSCSRSIKRNDSCVKYTASGTSKYGILQRIVFNTCRPLQPHPSKAGIHLQSVANYAGSTCPGVHLWAPLVSSGAARLEVHVLIKQRQIIWTKKNMHIKYIPFQYCRVLSKLRGVLWISAGGLIARSSLSITAIWVPIYHSRSWFVEENHSVC